MAAVSKFISYSLQKFKVGSQYDATWAPFYMQEYLTVTIIDG